MAMDRVIWPERMCELHKCVNQSFIKLHYKIRVLASLFPPRLGTLECGHHIFFFQRTQRGGFVHELDDKTKLVPIARWCQQRMMHISRMTENIFKGELVEKENESRERFTVEDDARLEARLKLRNKKDDNAEKDRQQVAAMAIERCVQAQQDRNKAQLITEEASAVVTAQSSSNQSGLTVEQRCHVREHMAARARKIAEKTWLKQKEREDRRQALVLDHGLRKAAREKAMTQIVFPIGKTILEEMVW
jgi:primase-polymerase (primpol)-like protein